MDAKKYQEVLKNHKESLEKQLQLLGVQDPNNPSDWVTAQKSEPEADSNNVADHTEDYNESRATLAVLESEYNDIVSALGRISDGTYGKCSVCELPISEDRLEVFPEASTCTEHAF